MPVQKKAQLVKVAEKVNGETPMDISSKINLENIPLPIQSNISWQLPAWYNIRKGTM